MNIFKRTIVFFITFTLLTGSIGTYAAEDVVIDNPYECSSEELQAYINNKMESLEKGATPSKKWSVFKVAYTQKKMEEGDDDCAPFWEESVDLMGLLNGLQDAFDAIGGFLSDPTSFFDALLQTIKDRMQSMVDKLIEEITKGICERLSQDFLMGKLQDAAEDHIKEQTDLNLNLDRDNVLEQIMDQTVCARGGEMDELLNYGSRSCDLLGDPNDPKAERARQGKAEDMVDEKMDKLDEYLWGD
jgi:hypothetical protein